MSINVRTFQQSEKKAMQITRADYANLLLNEKKRHIQNRAQS